MGLQQYRSFRVPVQRTGARVSAVSCIRHFSQSIHMKTFVNKITVSSREYLCKSYEILRKNDGNEESRRFSEMMKMYAMNGMGGMDMNMFAADQTLTLNANNALVKYIFENKDSEYVPMFCEQLYDLAVIANQQLSVDAMTKFVERSNKIMMLLAK